MILAEPRPDERQSLGHLGEDAAARVLREAGLTVVEQRYRRRVGEIDLVATDGDLVVFAEVKTRRGPGYGRPAEAVTATKQRRMARAALVYLQARGWLERPCRFDVVEVFAEGVSIVRTRHIEDAFRLWPTG